MSLTRRSFERSGTCSNVNQSGTQFPIAIVGMGVRCAVGLTAPSAAAAVRAGVSRLCQHPYLIDKVGEPMIVAREPTLPPQQQGAERFSALAQPAIKEAMAGLLKDRAQRPALAVLIGLPSPRPGLPLGIESELTRAVAELGHPALESSGVTFLPQGNAAGLLAMERGCQLLRQGRASFCLAGGVDSYLTADSLEWMDEVGILKSTANRNGFPPGEAAGFCLLTTEPVARQWGLPVLASIIAHGAAHEQSRIRTETICVGRGLSDAIFNATSTLQLPAERVDESICDLNGEPYRSEEFAFTVLRTQLAFVDFTRYVTPADCWGDVGAASGPLFTNLAVAAGLRGYAKGPRTMVWASSETGERAATILKTSPPAMGGHL